MSRSDTVIRELFHFDGQWRSYQKRVLDRVDQYLKDNRIHIVAAPGSGKTTLGIELIRRLNAPALILSPSINIRDQWLSRIRETYLPEGCETAGILSNTMKHPALVNAITYQALHSAIAGLGARGRIPGMNLHWLEVLLQGFLYDDMDSFPSDRVFRERLMELLKSHGLIQRRKVGLSANENVNKLLRTSKGKINSIVRIVGEEYRNLGGELRLLILTDYIKKEYLSALGDSDKSVNELGVVPIFENIRRAYEGEGGKVMAFREGGSQLPASPVAGSQLRLAALSGSVVLIPGSAKNALEELLTERGATAAVKECGAAGYYQVSVGGSQVTASALVTELFNRGRSGSCSERNPSWGRAGTLPVSMR